VDAAKRYERKYNRKAILKQIEAYEKKMGPGKASEEFRNRMLSLDIRKAQKVQREDE
jgi:hypothetical protein